MSLALDEICQLSKSERDPNHMTQVTWRDYVDARLRAIEVAVEKAELLLKERLLTMNEVREQLRDQAATFATRESVELVRGQQVRQIDALSNRIGELEKGRANDQGRSVMLWAVMGVALTALNIGLRFLIP